MKNLICQICLCEYGESLDDAAFGDDETGLCENCQNELEPVEVAE